jgi:hypothetical protein
MGCIGGDAPKFPKAEYAAQLELQKEQGSRYLALSERQQQWAEDQWTQQLDLLRNTLDTQMGIAKRQDEAGQEDRARYKDIYQPIEDDLVKDFMDFDSPERRNLDAGRAQAGVQQQFDAQRRNAEQRLSSYGVDPSQLRAGALDLNVRMDMAAQQAAQGNAARNRVEDLGRSLRAEAINIGKGYPSQVAGAYGQALAAGNSAVGNMNNTVSTGAGTMGTGGSWASQGQENAGMTQRGILGGYQGQLAGYDSGGGALGALGGLAGQALGGWASGGFMTGKDTSLFGGEGGGVIDPDSMGGPGPSDTVPAMLEKGEYVIPEDVVRRLGTNHLDKLIAKQREGGEQQGVKAGEMPRPDGVVPGGPDGTHGVPVQGYEGGGVVGKPVGVYY